ncbi:uncharacterized protein M421DRAFT_286580 [Didymella exigua CBS 183.55]|uniref:Secreted protein n=1 Tax=Didymella exigua CBS 183.55 TaxID=1150837 RepID=A0A6A5RXA0_9PLEO|nr:uncharacterized protein M421DRAFT_286580 [Didymella exigua CBS 183.55]KAF1932203.1 hypothetical protein M421DRAFT_286580 [Didymella exigua CBS 183.55]
MMMIGCKLAVSSGGFLLMTNSCCQQPDISELNSNQTKYIAMSRELCVWGSAVQTLQAQEFACLAWSCWTSGA